MNGKFEFAELSIGHLHIVAKARLRLSAWPGLQTVLGVVVFTVCVMSTV